MELPVSPGDCGILILALPRTIPDGALDRFLENRGLPVDLAFLYGDGAQEAAQKAAAENCVRGYRQRGGIYARAVRVGN
jgi:hypothetical protein